MSSSTDSGFSWFSDLIRFKGINDSASSGKGNNGSWWHAVAKQLLKLPIADTFNNVPIEDKALGDKIFLDTENFNENKKYKWVSGLLWSVLENSGKENYESKTLN